MKYNAYIEKENKKCNIGGKTRDIKFAGHLNRVDYRPRIRFGPSLDVFGCADLCGDNDNCKFFYFNTQSFCDLFESCSGKFEPVYARHNGTIYQKREQGNT